jgi:Radical SAM superfamily.
MAAHCPFSICCFTCRHFTVFCSSETPQDLTAEIEYVRNNIVDYSDIDFEVVNYEGTITAPIQLDSFPALSETFCPAPYGMINIRSNKSAKPCCEYSNSVTITDRNFSIEDNSQYASIRAAISSNTKHPGCNECWRKEEQGAISRRQQFIEKFLHACNTRWFDNIELRDITVSATSFCNFKCRICNPDASTRVAKEQNNLRAFEVFGKIPLEEDFLSKIDFNSCESVHLLGGEPLINPNLEKLLTRLIDLKQAHNMSISINTNGSVYKPDIMQLLQRFKSIEIIASIDDVGRRFEIQRGGKWNEVAENLNDFSKFCMQNAHAKLSFSVTVNTQNLLYLDNVVSLSKTLNANLVWGFVTDPAEFSVANAPQWLRDLAIEKYQSSNYTELNWVTNFLRKFNNRNDLSHKFVTSTESFDQKRNTDFYSAHPELIPIKNLK